MERNDATGFVADNQTLNAPITDFEVHFLSDCEEEYDEDETPWSCGVTWQVHADDATEAMQTAEQKLVPRFPTFTGEPE